MKPCPAGQEYKIVGGGAEGRCLLIPCPAGASRAGSLPENLRIYRMDVRSLGAKKGDVADPDDWADSGFYYRSTEDPVWEPVGTTGCYRPVLSEATDLLGVVVDGATYLVREGGKLVLKGTEYVVQGGKVVIDTYSDLPGPAKDALESAVLGIVSLPAAKMLALYNISVEAFQLACSSPATRVASGTLAAGVAAAATLNAGPLVLSALGVTVTVTGGVAIGVAVGTAAATGLAFEYGCPLLKKHHPGPPSSNDGGTTSTPTATPTPAPTATPTPDPYGKLPGEPATLTREYISARQGDVNSGRITISQFRALLHRWDCQRTPSLPNC